ncbi:MAG: excisionase family DNA-binding protein [Gemmataceae bacterium]|nr:excisionase family DNA-binding protein [Gemmataceae bacterium]
MALITIKEAARRLAGSRGLVYALVRAGKIRHERHGTGRGTIRIEEDALDDHRRASCRPEQPESEVTPRPSS